jgi:hypothetical protein
MSNMKRLVEDFNYYFDDIHGDIVIAGISFSASDILKEMDPIAYDEEFKSFLNNLNVDIYSEEV